MPSVIDEQFRQETTLDHQVKVFKLLLTEKSKFARVTTLLEVEDASVPCLPQDMTLDGKATARRRATLSQLSQDGANQLGISR